MRQFKLFDKDELTVLMNQIRGLKKHSGSRTAEGLASQVKNNKQIERTELTRALFDKLEDRLLKNPAFQVFALPKSIPRMFFNLYEEGDYYGVHSDAAIIKGRATDLSFTVFLSDPHSYEGGELSMKTDVGELDVKLSAGYGMLYSTGVLHEVKEVKKGARWALVGWVESFVHSAEDRQLLIGLADLKEDLKSNGMDNQAIKMNKLRNDLIRRFAR